MRIVRFEAEGKPRLGVLADGEAVDIAAAAEACGLEAPGDVHDLIARWDEVRERVESAVEQVRAKKDAACRWKESEVRLRAPLTRPGKLLAIGLNYHDHAEETSLPVPKNPLMFAKFSTSIVGPGDEVVIPTDLTSEVDFEVELAAVIGRTAKRVAEERALEHVFGYTVLNDVSARDLQFEDGQWIKGKGLDTFAPIGPCIVTADELGDPQRLAMRMTVNGRVMQESSTERMIFTVARLVSYLSQLMTLEPGDVIATGTPAGVGMGRKPPKYLKPGDVMIAEIEGIGKLTNRVSAQSEARRNVS